MQKYNEMGSEKERDTPIFIVVWTTSTLLFEPLFKYLLSIKDILSGRNLTDYTNFFLKIKIKIIVQYYIWSFSRIKIKDITFFFSMFNINLLQSLSRLKIKKILREIFVLTGSKVYLEGKNLFLLLLKNIKIRDLSLLSVFLNIKNNYVPNIERRVVVKTTWVLDTLLLKSQIWRHI